jgi:FixJ family two-component response regulator
MRLYAAKITSSAGRARGTQKSRKSNASARSASQSKEPSRTAAPTILLVDDDPSTLDGLGRLIKSAGLRVKTFDRPSALLNEGIPVGRICAILDVNLPEMNGIMLHAELIRMGYSLPTIFISGCTDEGIQRKLEGIGAVAILFKPVHERVLFEAIRLALNAPWIPAGFVLR